MCYVQCIYYVLEEKPIAKTHDKSTPCKLAGFPHFPSCLFPRRTFPEFFKVKIKILQGSNLGKKCFRRIKIFKKITQFLLHTYSFEISRTLSFFLFPGTFQAWKFIFSFSSFSRISRVRGSPELHSIDLLCTSFWSMTH